MTLKGVGSAIYRWFERLFYRIVNGQEPIIVRGLVALAVVVAAKFGFNLDDEVVWGFLAIMVPTLASARLKVDPSANPVGWKDVVKAALTDDPDIETQTAGPGGQLESTPTGEPEWLDEFTNVTDEEE